jgi:Na+-driven multidrug efflux pump
VFHGPALSLLFGRAQPDVLYDAKIYLIGSGTSYCGIALEEAACGALRGIGETRSSLSLSLIMNLSYVLLNVVFINFLHMGIFGLVISMNISRYMGAACAMIYLAKINTTLNFKF